MTSTSQNATAAVSSSATYPNSLTPLPGIGQQTTTTTVTSDVPLTTTVHTYPATTGYLFTTGGLFLPGGFMLEPTAFLNTAQTVCATDLQVQSATESQLHRASSSRSKSCEDLTARSEKTKKTYCQEEVDAYINDKVAEKIRELKLKMDEKEEKAKIEAKKVIIEEKVEQIEEKLRSRSTESRGGGCHSRENSGSSTSRQQQRAVCTKCHDVLVKELSLDEKIKRIREELNLPPEKSERCADSMHSRHYYDFHFGDCHRKHECNDADYNVVGRSATTKYKTNVVRPRSSRSLNRSRSALEVNRSRSRSLSAKSTTANRPPWRCTSTNDYTHTMVSRADLLARQYAKDYIAAERSRHNSAGTQTYNDRHKACQTGHGEATTYYKSHYEPALASYHHIVNESRPKQPQYYKTCTSYYKTTEHLPNINVASTTTTTQQHCTTQYDRPSTSLGYDYSSAYYNPRATTPKYNVHHQETVKYPSLGNSNTAKYICYPAVDRSVKQPTHHATYYQTAQQPACTKSQATMSLKPIETTKGGAIYRNPARANEIHYVSDNARNSWYSGAHKNGIVKIHNAGTTIIHD